MTNINELLQTQQELKNKIAQYNAQLDEINGDIAQFIAHTDEGSKTESFGNFKVTRNNVLNRTLNAKSFEKWSNDGGSIPDEYHGLVEYKLALNKSVMKEMEQNDPHLLSEVRKFVTTKPGKTQITVKEVEQ